MSRDAKTCAQWIREYPGDVPVRVALAVSNILDRKRRSAKVLKLPGKTKAERESKLLADYNVARHGALLRSEVFATPRCEVYDLGIRCLEMETLDPDHVLGGAYRKECERLGSEGIRITCRRHHDLKHANVPTHRYHLDEAKAHAIRIGSKRLLALVEKALARDAMKHPERTTP